MPTGTRVRRSGGCSGFRQASFRRAGASNCGGVCPPFPPANNLPIPIDDGAKPVIITGNLHGNLDDNQRDVMWQIKEALKAGGWTVLQSYNASGVLPAPGVDSWVTYLDLRGTGGGGVGDSWIVLKNASNTMQLCFQILVSGGWLEVQRTMSPSAGFTGGTPVARPTATDEILDSTAGYLLGTGPPGNTQFYALVWIASDISYTRVATFYAGRLRQFWQFDKLFTTPTGWANPFLMGVFSWGNTDYTVAGNQATIFLYMTILGSGGTFKSLLTPAPNTVTSVEGTLDSNVTFAVPNQVPIANAFSNQYIWVAPLGYMKRGGAASVNGFWGYTHDQWWTIPAGVFIDCDTMGDAFDYIILGQMLVRWGLGAPAGRLGEAGSTNYPSSRWYGRSAA